MASYRLILKPSVEKDLRSLPQSVVSRVFKQIEALQENPIPRGSRKLSAAEELYRVRVGDYRIVYGVDKDARQVVVYYVRHRRDAYRHL
ncbi:MAG TPA: type II toxin-antitoxin system RelE/ParE family toxin [Sedimentisphaerales bacterium]|jgi:mRNA interferase RelE/StbE|nr:type II toxin-antitoxin system RelE/ParE family toxin [Sedimentisphaerales bacterium]HNU29692.1 type II toxin-antitoxin system RelE/ParE family toxin [Sedimentisphaerales bacterium]